MWYLKDWYDEHPEARPLHVETFSFAGPRFYGIDYAHPFDDPRLGWYALSINHVLEKHQCFLQLEPVERIGYSICIYNVTAEDAARMRRKSDVVPVSRESQR